MAKIRIQKVLAEAGVASRRGAEQMIVEGRVRVNGSLVTDLPCFVDPQADHITVDNHPIRKRPGGRLYFLLNKPRGVVCTQSDPAGRPRAVDLVPEITERVYCIGRLDVDNTGLILLTNDGALTQYLTHPRYGVPKTYVVEIDGRLSEQQVASFKAGVYLDGRKTAGVGLRVLRKGLHRSLIQVTLGEGRNREVRRVIAGFGFKATRLKRTAIGPITDRGLKVGHYRPLQPPEVDALRRAGRLPLDEPSAR